MFIELLEPNIMFIYVHYVCGAKAMMMTCMLYLVTDDVVHCDTILYYSWFIKTLQYSG